MVAVNIDTINELELEEERGVIRSVTRNALVEFGYEEITAFRDNTSILRQALQELDDRNISDGSHIGDPNDTANPYQHLSLVKRSPKLVSDNQKVNVRLRYDHVLDGHNQLLTHDPAASKVNPQFLFPELNTIFGKGRCSVVDKTTNFFYPEGDDSRTRTPIQVAYTFPPWEKGVPATAFHPDFPRTILQGGEISIPFPQANCSFQGLVVTTTPYLVARRIIRYINSERWNGEPALMWLCTEVSWELNGYTQRGLDPLPVYKMGFEFQFNSDTWEPFVIFNDSRWGNPPANPPPWDIQVAYIPDNDDNVMRLALNPITQQNQPAGAWKVPALPRRNFTQFFGATIDGMGPGP